VISQEFVLHATLPLIWLHINASNAHTIAVLVPMPHTAIITALKTMFTTQPLDNVYQMELKELS